MTKLEAERRASGGMIVHLQRTGAVSGGQQITERTTAYAPCWARDEQQRAEWEARLDHLRAAGFRRVVRRK